MPFKIYRITTQKMKSKTPKEKTLSTDVKCIAYQIRSDKKIREISPENELPKSEA